MIITGKGRRGLEAEGKMTRSRQCGIGEGEGREARSEKPGTQNKEERTPRLGRTGLHAWIKELGQRVKKKDDQGSVGWAEGGKENGNGGMYEGEGSETGLGRKGRHGKGGD